MTFRFMGLIPAMALVAAGTVHAQTSVPRDTGSMALPAPLPSGQVTITSPTARDTGSMAYPSSPGGVAQPAPARDTGGSMGATKPSGGYTSIPAPTPRLTRRGRAAAAATPMATPAAAPTPAPSAAGMAAARALDTAPGEAAVPYVDFSQPAAPKGRAMMRPHKVAAHPAAAAKKAATPAPAPAPTK